MSEGTFVTRRATLGALVASPLVVATKPVAAASSSDVQLLALGRDFSAVAARLDDAIASGIDFDDGLLEQLGRLEAEITATQASTMEGLWVKARAACWALLGDLDDAGDETTDRRMALSMVRDLIRLYDPGLEKPGALKRLVQDIESGAGNSATALDRLNQSSAIRPEVAGGAIELNATGYDRFLPLADLNRCLL